MAEARTPSKPARGAAVLLLLLLLGGCAPKADGARMLLLVTVDTLRADRLGCYGNALGLTPNIDALAADSVVFERAYAPTPFTFPSVSSLFTGRYPEEIGILGNRSALAPEIPTLAGAFRERGWRTAAVVSNLVLRANSGLAAHFDHYDDALPDVERTRQWPERIAAGTTDAALAVLREHAGSDAPLFLWVHYQDPHGPYTPPPPLRERFLAGEQARPDGGRQLPPSERRGRLGHLPTYQMVDGRREVAFYRAGYDAEVAYLDAELGRLLAAPSLVSLGAAAAVVLTADHGESLGENDYWFAHGERIDEVLLHVPLLLRLPGVAAGRRADVASLLDVAPTLLRQLLGDPIADAAPGRDLLADGADRSDSVVYLANLGGSRPPRFGIIEDGYRFVVNEGRRGPREQLFRLGLEEQDLSRAEPDRLERMRRALDRQRARLRRDVPESRQRLSEADIRNLEALGYLEEPDAGGAP